MKNVLLFFLAVFSSLICNAQEKTIKGFVYDDYTNYRIEGVMVSPSLFKDTVFSNEKGKFVIVVPSKYRDTLVFKHLHYYLHIDRVYAGDAMRPKSIRLIPKSYKLDTVCYAAYKENIWLKGLVKDRFSQKPVLNAEIRLENNYIISYSDFEGRFEFALPKSNKNLIVNHPDFITSISEVKKNSRHDHYFEIWLDQKNPPPRDSISKKMDNLLGFTVNELFTGSFGLQYEHIFRFRHGIGIYLSNYLFGFGNTPLIEEHTSRYKGIKFSPYYSFYFMRNMRKGGYVTGKITGGYFDCYDLYYFYPYDSRYGETRSEQFYSFGFGFGVGMISALPKYDHVIFKIYFGYQYFPMHVPSTAESDRYGTMKVENDWWYIMGPGSVFEMKFTLGGIF